jgi:CDP-paratose 2-epimerase
VRILVTGGAGFVGSNLALGLARERPQCEVVALDSLARRGSELAPERLERGGVRFMRGDVRKPTDLAAVGAVDCIIDCAAEPSVQAGYARAGPGSGGSGAATEARIVVDSNLGGTVNCLELARAHAAGLIFLSTSRVYSIESLRSLPLEKQGERLALPENASGPGWSRHGIAPDFPTDSPRSLYGTTKLCSELLALEYASMYGLPIVVNRCGVIAGPWQLGRVDQGFVALWAARHLFGGSLSYLGFGGHGHQVRDVLHIDDLYDLVTLQLDDLRAHAGSLYCVGGGPERSTSLRELSAACAARTGHRLEIPGRPETHPADVPWFVSDDREARSRLAWAPRRSLDTLLDDVFEWLGAHAHTLEPIFGGDPPPDSSAR